MKYIIKFIIWLLLFNIIIDGLYTMISSPNSILNIIGLGLLIIVFWISLETKCFTTIKFTKK